MTISEANNGFIAVRPYLEPKSLPYNSPISTHKILDVCFSGNYSQFIAVLSEDQKISVWKIGDKIKLEKVLEHPRKGDKIFKYIRWHPYKNDQIFCFSEKDLKIVITTNLPTIEMMLPCLETEEIDNLFFIPRSDRRISFFKL